MPDGRPILQSRAPCDPPTTGCTHRQRRAGFAPAERDVTLTRRTPHKPHPGRYAFFDTDGVIEKAHPGMTIADIFREHGEEYFRKCEAQVISRDLARNVARFLQSACMRACCE
jgi:hypothetical protein